MRKVLSLFDIALALLIAMVFSVQSHAAISSTAKTYACNAPFTEVVHFCNTTVGKGAVNGKDYSNCLPFADQDIWVIPAGTTIKSVYPKVDVEITGTTVLEIGDDDDADGFVVDMAAGFATITAQLFNSKVAGAYLRVQTAGATDAADIDVVPTWKYYHSAGKEVKMNITTANTAGKLRVFIEGYKYCDAY